MADTIDTSMVLKLRKSISVGTQVWEELKLSEPTVHQLVESSRASTGLESMAMLLQMNAGIPAAAARQICQRDFQEAVDFFGRFGPGSMPTPGSA